MMEMRKSGSIGTSGVFMLDRIGYCVIVVDSDSRIGRDSLRSCLGR